MTIKPYVYTYEATTDSGETTTQSISFYPNFIIDTETELYGMIPINGKITGNITLTRGWSEETAENNSELAAFKAEINKGTRSITPTPIKLANNAEVVRKVRHNRTNLNVLTGGKPAERYTEVKVKPINREKFMK